MHYELMGAEPSYLIDPATIIKPGYLGPGAQPVPISIKPAIHPALKPPATGYVGYTGTVEDLRKEMEHVLETESAERLPYIAQILRRKSKDEKRANVAVEMMIWADRLDAAADKKLEKPQTREQDRQAASAYIDRLRAEQQAAPMPVPEKKPNVVLPLAIAGAVAIIAMQ